MAESITTMTRTEKLIIEKLDSLARELQELRREKAVESIEEISIHKAAKLMRIGSKRIIGYINAGKLKARVYRDKNNVKRYRLRIADIREFQENQSTVIQSELSAVSSTEEIAKKIFGQSDKSRWKNIKTAH